jgi:hypothetical protein
VAARPRHRDQIRVGSQAGAELLVEDGHLAIEHECAWLEVGDRGHELREALRVIPVVPGHETNALAILVGEQAIAVDLLLVDSAVAVEGLADLGRDHGGVAWKH